MNPIYIRIAVYVLLAVVCFGTGWTVQGWRKDSQSLDLAQAAQDAKDDAAAAASAAEDAQAASQAFAEALAVERESKTRVINREITRDVIKWVQKPSSQSVCLDRDGLLIHNASATGRVSEDTDTAGQPDAGTAGATAAEVITVVTSNYNICHDTANQLLGLQDWVRTLKQ